MKLVIPPEIKIGINRYQVTFKPHLNVDEHRTGSVNFRTGLIEIEPAMMESVRVVSLLHELIHAISYSYSLSFDDADIDRLAEGLAELLVNNWGIEFDWRKIPTHKLD